MRLAGLSLAHIGLCKDGNLAGWQPWVIDEKRAAATLERCKGLYAAEQIGGVYLVGGCGMLPSLIECGFNPSGQPVTTCWGSHSEGPMHSLVWEFAKAVPVVVSIAMPGDWAGLDALADECRRIKSERLPIELVLDASGSNASARMRATLGTVEDARVMCRLESRPLNGPLDDTDRFVTMSARGQALARRGMSMAGDIVFFNNGVGSPNLWSEPLALMFEKRGATVAQPLETMPQEGDSGGGV